MRHSSNAANSIAVMSRHGEAMLPPAEARAIQEALLSSKYGEFLCSVCSKVATLKCLACRGAYYCAKCERKEHSKKHRHSEPAAVIHSRACDVCHACKLELYCETCTKHVCMTCTTSPCTSSAPHALLPMNGARGLCLAVLDWPRDFVAAIQRDTEKYVPVKVEKKEPIVTPVASPPAPARVVQPAPVAPSPAPLVPPASLVPPTLPVSLTSPTADAPLAASDPDTLPHIGSDSMKSAMLDKYNAANAEVISLEEKIKVLANQVRLEVNKQDMTVALSYNKQRNEMQVALETVLEGRDEALAHLVAFNPILHAQYLNTHDATKPEYKPVVATPTIVQRVVPGKHARCARLEAEILALETQRVRANAEIHLALAQDELRALEPLGLEISALERQMVALDAERNKEFLLLTVFSKRLRDRIGTLHA
ncbi:hypothetical protein SDRG_08991 [Saprolegnia diclina VS20]|uniref:B box-type domain-containing protein n=1 Tax=Saprolegnia diclina (strain VS20) TaxID=1156394 RepID=T0QFL2_SAPDV|nr:hypothetical protein SDRG_08991 [Saprolegnia diclina VS20]EQC33481.1 hypothetical protein SDRG_08991 [Saprolegnia diclina VS20]|eukprot:XP_008613121.1 hypothetical protein SDRG_08991 [Saprolegnia diclina VS20]